MVPHTLRLDSLEDLSAVPGALGTPFLGVHIDLKNTF